MAIGLHGWRATYLAAAATCIAVMMPLAFYLRRNPPSHLARGTIAIAADPRSAFGLSPNALQALLAVAGIGCCVAMSMPQVHLVAYCADLGYGVARGAEMLSLMLGWASRAEWPPGGLPIASDGTIEMSGSTPYAAVPMAVHIRGKFSNDGFEGITKTTYCDYRTTATKSSW